MGTVHSDLSLYKTLQKFDSVLAHSLVRPIGDVICCPFVYYRKNEVGEFIQI